MEKIGLYVHIPFCGKKCPYCDFYSATPVKSTLDRYTDYLERQLRSYSGKGYTADTLYFGGGTPNLLGGERLSRLVQAARDSFSLDDGAEISVECNPATTNEDFLHQIQGAGVNRLSLGLQSANEDELRFLGRRHTPEQAAQVVENARKLGFSNLSLDLMIGLPHQTEEKLRHSIDFCAALGVEHVSSYLLKIEPNTDFFRQQDTLFLPDEEEVCKLYLAAVERMAYHGFALYEVSNFAKKGYESRHNLKYWHCEEYLGFGPSAHSFLNKKRFYYERSLDDYLAGAAPVQDGEGGSPEEWLMLQLRLTEGVSNESFQKRFGKTLPEALLREAHRLEAPGLLAFHGEKAFHLTPEGFLVSNLLIRQLIDCLEESPQ